MLESSVAAQTHHVTSPEPRVLFVAWQSQATRLIYPVARLLVGTEAPRYEFTYVRGVEDACEQGFLPFVGMKNLHAVYRLDELPPLFTNRLIPRSRADFAEHLERLGLDPAAEPIAILARSEGRKVTDNLEAFAAPEFDAIHNAWIYYGFARGVRHVPGAEEAIASLKPGDELVIDRDRTNRVDSRALLLLDRRRARLGFVPHTLIEDFNAAMDHGVLISAEVLRVNLAPAPVHQRLLVRYRVEQANGFRPLSTTRYQPLAADAMRVTFAPTLGAR